ncbi:MAG: hypothetical protein V3T70_00845, partial [Phycisphaerae bacterium]
SSIDGRRDHPAAAALRDVEHRYGVRIVYGRRRLHAIGAGITAAPDVLLLDLSHAEPLRLELFKFRLYERFGLRSDPYEHVWDYEQYVRLAEPGLAAVRAIGGCGPGIECVVVAHEFMGMPTALAAMLHEEYACRTVFHAHEVAAVRKIVEEHPGHDAMFYNVLRRARSDGRFLKDVFGSQIDNFKHPLVKAARHCDAILAVGDQVVEELRFLGPEFADAPIHLAYNGIPAHTETPAQETASRERLRDYAETLLGFRPDFVFTHVTRLVRSKGLWRDLDVLAHVDRALLAEDRTAVLFVLSTEIGGPRPAADVRRMEREWDWPLAHREGWPDLTSGEAAYYASVQAFNARSRACKIVFINQFGFDREHCGERMPAAMEFWDVRRGSDVEFGLSVYEPFGIAPIEAMSYGCVSVISTMSGCAGFVNRVTDGEPAPNVLIADYTALDRPVERVEDLLNLNDADRRRLEGATARDVANRLMKVLPRTPADRAVLLDRGHRIASRMSWDAVANSYILPVLRDVFRAH